MNQILRNILSSVIILVCLLACSPPELSQPFKKPSVIDSFDSCVDAGYQVSRSNPPGCHAPGGEVFYKQTNDGRSVPSPEQGNSIKTFEDCVNAGNAVLKSYPPKCVANNIVYTKAVPQDENKKQGLLGARCKDLCGNGRCEEMVCMAIGCPCAETADSCPQDCK